MLQDSARAQAESCGIPKIAGKRDGFQYGLHLECKVTVTRMSGRNDMMSSWCYTRDCADTSNEFGG